MRRNKLNNRISFVLAFLICFTVIPGITFADTETEDRTPVHFDYGIRSGWDTNNDQLLLGVQTEVNNIWKVISFAPSFDYGTGNDLATYGFNSDFRIGLLSLPGSITEIYLGAGPTLFVWDHNNGPSDTEVGLTFTAGLKFRLGESSRYNLEARIGSGDVPETRILLGILF